jgi:type IV pilus assembly protein PilQ
LITTRFNSAVDRITPMQTPALKTSSMIVIDLRESVPCYIEQAKDLLLVHFDASSIPPKPVEQADLPSWKKVIAQTTARGEEIEDKKAGYKALRPKDAKKYTGEKIALDFYDTDIKNVFRILMEISGKNFAIDKDVIGRVTLTLAKPVPWDQALDLILNMNGLNKAIEGDIIRIRASKLFKTADELKLHERKMAKKIEKEFKALEPLVTDYITVNYANAKIDILPHLEALIAKDIVRGGKGFGVGEGVGATAAGAADAAAKADRIETELAEEAVEQASVTADERTNTIIIIARAETIERAKEIVKKLDKVTPQVIIEARIVEASTNFSREIGVEWSAEGGIQGDAANAGIGPQRGYDELGGTYGYDMAMNFPIAAVNPASIGFNFLRIAGSPFLLNAKLMAMESQGEGKIISSPKIVTLDNKKAVIKQGLRYPYTVLDKDGVATTKFEDIDLLLEVTPHVTPNERISMTINITKNDLGNIINNQQSFTTKEASTELLVNDGNTVVIGGIMKTTKKFSERGLPWLSKIPVLGWLFKSRAKSDEKEELLIFITPRIIRLEQRGVIDD